MPITIRHTTPPANLANYVERFWHVTTDQPVILRVIPDGCWDIVINNGEPPEFIGPMTQAFKVPLEAGEHHYGVRFKPGTFFVALKVDLAEQLDINIALNKLVDPVPANNSPMKLLEEVVTDFAEKGLLEQDKTVQTVVAALNKPEQQPVLYLYDNLPASISTIQRKFKKYVGFTPRHFQRILRQLAVNGELMTQNHPQLGSLAADFGYVDQAHMTHELRLLSGATPSNLHREYDDYVQYNSDTKADTDSNTTNHEELL